MPVAAMTVLYLDTNHLSLLARHSEYAACEATLRILRSGRATIAISLYHLIELSAPTFVSRPAVQSLIESVPYLWALPLDVLWDKEIIAAHARACGIGDAKAIAFSDSLSEWGKASPSQVAGVGIAEFLDFLMIDQRHRQGFLELAMHAAAQYDHLKRDAAVVRNPDLPIILRIKDLRLEMTPAGLHLPRPLSAEEVFERVGGLAGFPSYQVAQKLGLTRLKDGHYVSEANDVLDEWHAAYAPYATFTVLDRRTYGRLQSTRLECVARTSRGLTPMLNYLKRGMPAD